MILSEESLERFERAINFEETDRPPLGYLFFGGASWVLKELGADLNDIYYSPEGIAKAQIKAKELFGHDNVMSPWGCLTVEAEAFGCTIKRRGYYPRVEDRPVKSERDLKELDVPNPRRSARMPLVLESLRILANKVGEHTPVIGMVCSPFIVASEIRGFEVLLKDVFRKPDFVHEILDITTAGCIEYAKSMCQEGVFAVMVENAFMSADLLDPRRSEEFIRRYTGRLLGEIRKLGVYVIEHNCAGSPYLDMELSLKPDVLNFAAGDILEIRERTRDICLMGNVDHAKTMLTGSRSEVYLEAKSCIGKGGKGFILSTGCEIPFNAPLENIRALSDAASEGW